MSDEALAQLRSVEWCEPTDVPATVADWLIYNDSMTRRLERHCLRLSVRVSTEHFISTLDVQNEQPLLPLSNRYWLREVTLFGDGKPWLFGRTVIPQQTLEEAEIDLTQIGNTPLGRYLFLQGPPKRNFIHLGRCGSLWVRRSCLVLSGNPLLITELFLPDAPLYSMVSKTF
ncbi:chorismate lyase [Pectobacteriaceae bacterium CE90]|nr:chorismate lyase [Prodigiosinella sp. LS101]WJV54416.1 chorismate lyase [Prodigiosinella sp. LS101]WJV58777.1 chorismate lyase [Pectobacteriaceae bacterium C111]WJY14541.1 chorismate lyase [Pectobacteriaceae bacterium CE90]